MDSDASDMCASDKYAFARYGRFWAVYDPAGGLVCVTVYKKGATEVIRRLSPDQSPPQPAPSPPPQKVAGGRAPRPYDPYQ